MADATPKRRRRPSTTPEGRENQLVALATDLAEKQLAEGTASAQVITHYLKLATERERLEREKLRTENTLRAAQVDAMASAKRVEELYSNAIKAMKTYTSQSEDVEKDEDIF